MQSLSCRRLRIERTACKVYRKKDGARADVFDYLERFDNPQRQHSVRYETVSPVEFKEGAVLA